MKSLQAFTGKSLGVGEKDEKKAVDSFRQLLNEVEKLVYPGFLPWVHRFFEYFTTGGAVFNLVIILGR